MTIKRILIIALLAMSVPAAADFEVITEAYEVRLDYFQAPATENGGFSFKTCEDCERIRLNVHPGTRYSVNGKSVRLKGFRDALMQVRDRKEPTVVVKHHLESDTVVAISVTHI